MTRVEVAPGEVGRKEVGFSRQARKRADLRVSRHTDGEGRDGTGCATGLCQGRDE